MFSVQQIAREPIRVLFFLACLLAISGSGSATSVVAVWRSDRVTIAADSLTNTKENDVWSKHSGCKILEQGEVFFAFAGLSKDKIAGFDANAIANATFKSTAGGIQAKAARLAAVVSPALLKAVQQIYRDESQTTSAALIGNGKDKPVVLEAIVFGIEDGRAIVVGINFVRIDDPKRAPIEMSAKTGQCPGTGCGATFVFYIGEKQAINKKLNGESFVKPLTGNDVDDARMLVKTEMSDKPGTVGGSIDTLVIDSKGAQWIPPLGVCRQPKNANEQKKTRK